MLDVRSSIQRYLDERGKPECSEGRDLGDDVTEDVDAAQEDLLVDELVVGVKENLWSML